MMPFKNLLLILVCILTFCSCHITKRKYLSGYYVHHKGKSSVANNPKSPAAPAICAKEPARTEEAVEFSVPPQPDSTVKGDVSCRKNLKEGFQKMISPLKITRNPMEKGIFQARKTDPEASLVQKPLSLFWIVILLVLLLYLAVIIFAADSLLPLGHVMGIIFAALILLWLLRIV